MLNRRDGLRGLAAAGLALALSARARAERGEIRLVCGYPAGSGGFLRGGFVPYAGASPA